MQFIYIAYRYFSGSLQVLRYKSITTNAISIRKVEVEYLDYHNSDKYRWSATVLSVFEITHFSAVACVDGLV